MTISNQSQRDYFQSGETRSVEFRQQQLARLLEAINRFEEPLYDALWTDLGKCREEAMFMEMLQIKEEIQLAIRKLPRWAKNQSVRANLLVFPSRNYIHYEPLGCALIIAPWNYPVNLLINPLIGAIAAGCCATLKPSPLVPTVSHVLHEMISWAFPPEYINLYEGHRDVNTALLDLRWDVIFFTGSPALGKVVMAAAAKNLTPCILELGGKSPCIVDAEADIEMAAERIMWGKTLNNGQTCVAPDYLLVHASIAKKFEKELEKARVRLQTNYPVVKKIRPHVEDVWTQEIFGPEFPMRTFHEIQEVITYINEREKPLAFYYFGDVKKGEEVINQTSSGGAVINNTLLHLANTRLPFGGVGNSGMGRYHNHASFLAFSNPRSVLAFRQSINRIPFIRRFRLAPINIVQNKNKKQ